MYDIIKNIIENGIFRVSDLTNKIDTLWAESKLSDDERNLLVQMMTDHLNPNSEAPELKEMYERLEARVTTLKAEVQALKGEEEPGEEEPGEEEPGEEEPGTVIVPAWEPWDGISNKYQYGAAVSHNGKYFLDVLQDMQNTWEPESAGVDERYWKEITKEQAEKIISGDMTVDDVLGA